MEYAGVQIVEEGFSEPNFESVLRFGRFLQGGGTCRGLKRRFRSPEKDLKFIKIGIIRFLTSLLTTA